MRHQRPQLFGRTLFVDLMMSSLVIVTSLLIVSNAIERKKQAKDSALATEGKIAVTAEWPDDSADDMDLYVRDPSGNIAFFQNSDTGLMHLEHDDLGTASDTVMTSAGKITIVKNEERVIIRGIIPGEYLVNVHAFRMDAPHRTPVRVRLYKLKGSDTQATETTLTFGHMGEEQTAFRFTLGADGSVSGINHLSHMLQRSDGAPTGRDGR